MVIAKPSFDAEARGAGNGSEPPQGLELRSRGVADDDDARPEAAGDLD
jgi:hypothetical protein